MSKITLTQLANLQNDTTATTAINANSTVIQTAFDNTLSRDGTSPNQLLANIDMNSFRILNLPTPATADEPLRLQDLSTFVGGGTVTNIPAGGVINQVLTKTSSSTDFAVAWGSPVANPTASVGLTAVNGTAITYMRSDAAPPLSQAIVPTWTGLHSYTATAGGIHLTGNPNPSLISTATGGSVGWAILADITAASATAPEGAGSFNITSGVGSANPNSAYKIGLSATALSNSGSANVWAQTNVGTINTGGIKRGCIVYESDLNILWAGNFSGSPSNPYAVNYYASGTNTGGYGTAAFAAQFGGSASPMWNFGLALGPSGFQVFNTASIFDESNSPTSIKINGTHTVGIDMSSASVGTAFVSPFFAIGATGGLSIAGTSSGTMNITVQATAGTPTLLWPTGSGTLVSNAVAPLTINSATGAISLNGGAITASSVIGGSTASSSLTLESTSGVGTTDSIIFKTGSQATRWTIDTSGNLIAASGVKIEADAATGYYLGTTVFVQTVGGVYNILFDPGGTNVMQYGNASDPTNYINNTTHKFRSRDTTVTFLQVDANGALGNGFHGSAAPTTVTGTTSTISSSASTIIYNASGTHTTTLPAASSFVGRWLYVKSIAAQAVNSASSNVVPIGSATAGTALLAATAGKFAALQSDGTNWITMMSN